MWKTVLILLCVLVSVATAQTTAQTPAGSFGIGEVKSWQLEAVKYEGDKWAHWHFQADERRFRFSDHEWIENTPERWFNEELGTRLLLERICKNCLRWEVLMWKSSPERIDHRSNLEPTVIDFKELVARIEKKKGREWK